MPPVGARVLDAPAIDIFFAKASTRHRPVPGDAWIRTDSLKRFSSLSWFLTSLGGKNRQGTSDSQTGGDRHVWWHRGS